MTRKLLFLILPLFLLTFVSVAFAQTGTDSAASKLKMQRQETAKQAIAAKRQEFNAGLEKIKDQKKITLVKRIDEKLAIVNKKHTDRFAQVLSNLQTILDKLGEDVDKVEAQAAIDSANAAVEAQAAKTYVITISTESALKSDVGAVTSQLRLDLSATHKLVVDAKQTVQALRKDNNAIMKKDATNSANQ